MVPIELKLRRFRSFTSEVRFVFPQAPGLYFMHGDNQVEPRLEGNGAGKSSLWEALCWCLSGKTSRGIKAGDAANWDEGKGCSVAFTFDWEFDGTWMQYTVERTWSPNSWTLTNAFGDRHDLVSDGDSPLAAMLRLKFESFLHSIFLAQAQPFFLDLKPEPKAALFSEIMDLDHWLDLSRKAGQSASAQDEENRKTEQIIAGLEGKRSSIDVSQLEEQADRWEASRRQRLDELADEHARLLADYRRVKGRRGEATSLEQARVEVSRLRDAVQEARQVEVERRREADSARRHKLGTDSELSRCQHLVDHASLDYCKSCERPIPKEHRATTLRRAEDELDEAKREAASAEAEFHQTMNRHAAAVEAVTKTIDKLRDAEASVQDLEREQERIGRDLAFIDRSLDEVEDRSERVEAEANPYTALIDQQAVTLHRIERELREEERRLSSGRETYELRSAWVRWFKEIRLEQIGEALTELEIEVNSALASLGLLDWALHFEVDDLRRSGSVSRGFTVFVQSPHNSRPVPWESWSGGESQRLRIAAQQGLGDLIRARTGVTLNLEVWDEPTQWLSPQGVTDLLDSLRDRARREGRQIWVVDHRSLGYGAFDGVVKITKTEEGSYISGHEQLQNAGSRPMDDEPRPRTSTRRKRKRS